MKTRTNPIARFLCPDFSFADFAPRARIVDVGCGSGCHLVALRGNGCEAAGIEPDFAEAEKARRHGFTVLDGKAESLPLADASVDGVVCCIVVPYT
ncbi:MAG TPA: methyltransferase domain-containing protein, partial [Gemmataceae bacterium]|nr:methyltransferase domain-containing protein [Gemmataceae bacterium]